MSDAFEQALRKAMVFLGRTIEAAIGKARQAKAQVGGLSGVQPIMSVEGQLSQVRIKELIDISVQRAIEGKMPDVAGKVVMEVAEGPASYGSRFLSRSAEIAISVEIGGASIGRQGDISRGYVIRGSVASLPFKDGRFPYILARLATPLQGDMVRAVKEIGRLLAPGGQGTLVDYHPFGPYSRRGAGRLRPAESGIHRFEDYYRCFRTAGLRVVDVGEVFIDDQMRKYFSEDEIRAYRELKGSAFLILIYFYKPRGKV